MSRQRIAVTISSKNMEWVDENYNNRSAFVDDLLTRARKGEGEIQRAVAQYQKEQLEREKATLETQMQSVEKQLETIESRLQRTSEKKQTELSEAAEVLERAEKDPTNPAVQNQAEKLDMTPQELLDKLDSLGGEEA
jgi:DNA anti-recombination protein RmuC